MKTRTRNMLVVPTTLLCLSLFACGGEEGLSFDPWKMGKGDGEGSGQEYMEDWAFHVTVTDLNGNQPSDRTGAVHTELDLIFSLYDDPNNPQNRTADALKWSGVVKVYNGVGTFHMLQQEVAEATGSSRSMCEMAMSMTVVNSQESLMAGQTPNQNVVPPLFLQDFIAPCKDKYLTIGLAPSGCAAEAGGPADGCAYSAVLTDKNYSRLEPKVAITLPGATASYPVAFMSPTISSPNCGGFGVVGTTGADGRLTADFSMGQNPDGSRGLCRNTSYTLSWVNMECNVDPYSAEAGQCWGNLFDGNGRLKVDPMHEVHYVNPNSHSFDQSIETAFDPLYGVRAQLSQART